MRRQGVSDACAQWLTESRLDRDVTEFERAGGHAREAATYRNKREQCFLRTRRNSILSTLLGWCVIHCRLPRWHREGQIKSACILKT